LEGSVVNEFAGDVGVGLEKDIEFVEDFAVGVGVVIDLFLHVVFELLLCRVSQMLLVLSMTKY
jgi:hypothetical protein